MLNPISNRFNAADLWQKDHDHFLHPYTHFDSFKKEGSLVLVEGDGCYVTDVNGKRYFDGIGGMWCVNVGYGRKRNRRDDGRAGADALLHHHFRRRFQCAGRRTRGQTRRASRRVRSTTSPMRPRAHAPSIQPSGSPITINRAAAEPNRRYIISRKNSYHGSTYLGMSVGLRDGDQSPHFKYIPDLVHHLSAPYPYRRPDGMTLEAFSDFLVEEFRDKIAELGAENIAAFIAEPAQASGGVTIPPPRYLERMRELCTENGILFIADEIVTAFGRLGHMFASKDEFGIVPDIIISAKGLTSGYIPLSAVIYSDEIHDVISAADPDGLVHPWLYLFRASGRLCGRPQEYRDHGARGPLRQCRQVGDYLEEAPRDALGLAHCRRCARPAADDVHRICEGQEDARRNCPTRSISPSAFRTNARRRVCWFVPSATSTFCRRRWRSRKLKSISSSTHLARRSARQPMN